MIEVKVPSVGESITEGTLGRWIKKSGDYVKSGEAVFEIETEKVTSEVYAAESGLLKTLVNEGAKVQIGQIVAQIDEKAPVPAGVAAAKENGSGKKAESPAPAAPTSRPADLPVSPGARFAAQERSINPADLSGTGKGGRVTVGDIRAAESKPETAAPKPRTAGGPRTMRKPMSQMRRKIAARLVSVQNEAALLTTFNECDMTNVMALRAKFQERFQAKHGLKLGFMSFFVKAVVEALHQVPAINAQIDGDDLVQNNYYDIGVAISTEKGLLVPVVRGADQLNFAQIETTIAEYAKKARAGKITFDDLSGGVFTITNGGTFGSLLSTPILNPPQSGILGMHSIQDRPMAVNGQVVIRPMMYLALTYDHRIVDGKEAVTFLVRIKEFIENPAVALLDL
jgi:2-oxoglutarate dehydrogenase E2 component (dihydrolipoamide succinyltransferase)